MAVDSSGRVYLAGWTESSNFPSNPVRARGGGVDGFIVKLDPATNQVIWATYLGGSSYDEINAIAVDGSGNVYVAGSTSSSNFPTRSAYSGTFRGGSSDAFAARLDSAGALVFSTFLGGSGSDKAYGIGLNSAGEIWVAGETASSNFPVLNAAQTTTGGGTDAFASRFNAGGGLLSSTYLGGSGTDVARAIAVGAGGAYLTGSTDSPNFPVVSAAQGALAGGTDAFVTKLSADGAARMYSTYLGGPAREVVLPETGMAIAVDSAGAAYVAGIASSMTFPCVGATQPAFGGGTTDGFVTEVAPSGASFVFSTYFGGNSTDEARSIGVHSDGSVYVGGLTTSDDLPLVNHIQTARVPSYDGFVVRWSAGMSTLLLSTYLAGSSSDTVQALNPSSSGMLAGGSTASNDYLPGVPAGLSDTYVVRIEEPSGVAADIRTLPTSVQYTVSGTDCSPGTYTGDRVLLWPVGAACSIGFAGVQGSGDTRLRFTSWQDASTANPRSLTAAPGLTIPTLNFASEHRITTVAAPAAGGTITATPAPTEGYYVSGTKVTLRATAAPGYKFVNWTGGITSTATSVEVTISAPATYTANFSVIPQVKKSRPGLFRQGFLWILDMDGDYAITGTGPGQDRVFAMGGIPGDQPVVGDWTGSGTTKVGIYRSGFWMLDMNGDTVWDATDRGCWFGGLPSDVAVTGDWNGDGKTDVGVFRQGFLWILDKNGSCAYEGAGPG